MSSPQDRQEPDVELLRSEEELDVGVVQRQAGRVGVRRRVEHERVAEIVERTVEHADIEHVPVEPDDEGDVRTLADGAVSIPVFEERLVVEKRRVVRERVVVRTRPTVEREPVEADLARERVEVTADPEVRGRVHEEGTQAEPPVTGGRTD